MKMTNPEWLDGVYQGCTVERRVFCLINKGGIVQKYVDEALYGDKVEKIAKEQLKRANEDPFAWSFDLPVIMKVKIIKSFEYGMGGNVFLDPKTDLNKVYEV